MKTVIEILKSVRQRLSTQRAWTKCVYARNERGGEEYATSSEATCWCLVGALLCEDSDGEGIAPAIAAIRRVLNPEEPEIVGFNDDFDTTHADVLKVLDRAIANEEQGERQ